MDWSKYYPANYSAITAEDVKQILEKKIAPVEDNANDTSVNEVDSSGIDMYDNKRKESERRKKARETPSSPETQAKLKRARAGEVVDELSKEPGGILQRAAGAAKKDAALQRDAQDWAKRRGTDTGFHGKKAAKREKQAGKFSAAVDVNQRNTAFKKEDNTDIEPVDEISAAMADRAASGVDRSDGTASDPRPSAGAKRGRKFDAYADRKQNPKKGDKPGSAAKAASAAADRTEDAQDDARAAFAQGDDAYAYHQAGKKKEPEKKKVNIPAPKDKQERDRDAWRAKRESWYPVDEKRLNQKRKHNRKDYRDDNLKKKVKGIEEPDFSKEQDTVTTMEWATKVFNNYHNIEEHCGWCDQTESKEMPTSQAMAGQIKELAKAIRGKDGLSIEGAASLVSKKQYDKLAPYLDKMSEDARQSILMVLMTDQKIANSVMKKMKTEEYDTCEIPSHRFILAEMYKKYQGMTWGEIGERLIKNTERRLVSLAYATKMGTIDAPSPEVQKLADECELEDLEKASKTFIEDDSDLTEQLENETIDEIVRVYNSFNEDEQAAVDALFNQNLDEDELLAELPDAITRPIDSWKQRRAQKDADKRRNREAKAQQHDKNVSDIADLKKKDAERQAKKGPGLLKKAWNKVTKDKLGKKQKEDPKKKEDPTAAAREKQDAAEKGAKDSSDTATAIKKDKPIADPKKNDKGKPVQDDPSLKQGVKTSTRGKLLNVGGTALSALAGSYEPGSPSIEEEESIERLDARRRIFKEKIKKLAYEKAKEILGKRQPVEVDITNETNKNNKSDDGDGLDAVQPMALKKKSVKDRKDPDIDNDGDTDDSDEFLHKKRKAISKAMEDKEEDSSKVKESGKVNNKVEMNPDEDKMKKESTGLAFVRKYKSKMNEGNTNPLHDQILELFRSSYASIDGEPAGAEFAVDDKPASASSIARALRCSPMEVQKMLDDMVEAGQISRVGDAYSYASPRPAVPMGSKPAEAQQ
ncbi:MAG: hypothetical protein CL432_09555 [Acidimicrobiaceae bacterium]|nr:hypothetical protein [Acidimicrobiaceae bacterium]